MNDDAADMVVSGLGGELISDSPDTNKELSRRLFEDIDLNSIDSYDNAVEFLSESGIEEIEDIDFYGTGFTILPDKEFLVGKPFIIVEWEFNQSREYGTPFVSAFVVTRDRDDDSGMPYKFIVNDGSSYGIYRQLADVTKSRMNKGKGMARAGLRCPRGLRKRNFKTTQNINGQDKEIEATAYNLA